MQSRLRFGPLLSNHPGSVVADFAKPGAGIFARVSACRAAREDAPAGTTKLHSVAGFVHVSAL